MSSRDATDAATDLFTRLKSFIAAAGRLPLVMREISNITRSGAVDLSTTIRGSGPYLAIAGRVSDELAGPEEALSQLATRLEREIGQVANALDQLEVAIRIHPPLSAEERPYVEDVARTLEVFITGYAETSRAGIEHLVDVSRGDGRQLPAGVGSTIGRIGDHANAILRVLDEAASWRPRAEALGA